MENPGDSYLASCEQNERISRVYIQLILLK